MLKFLITTSLLIIFLSPNKTFAQNNYDSVKISVITCAPGEPIYLAFGHSAIRVNDSSRNFDYTYDYGAFDMSKDGFILKFIKGELDYMMLVNSYYSFKRYNKKDKRWIREQVLNLSNSQKEKIINFLQNNAKPENRVYRYDFLLDNCATRVKDVLKKALKDSLILGKCNVENPTYRNLTIPYLKHNSWGRLAINIGYGTNTDRKISDEKATFLPQILETVIGNSHIIKNGKKQKLVTETKILYEPKTPKVFKDTFFTSDLIIVLFLIIILLITGFEILKKKHFFLFDAMLFFIFGLIGLTFVILWILWGTTGQSTLINNFDVIWAIPTHIIIAFFLIKTKRKTLLKYYFLTTSIIIGLFIPLHGLLPQVFDFDVILLSIVLFARSSSIYYSINR